VRAVRDAGGRAILETALGRISARRVVVAAGAWSDGVAARAGAARIGLASFRRHLFVTERRPDIDPRAPFAWHLDEPFYVRPESAALLLSGCDDDPHAPGDVRADPAAELALAERLARAAPRLAELAVARSWACLRTFAPDRRPVIGWDPDVHWLFRVAGLGGCGASASPALGVHAATRLRERLT
jgi:D-arginine dehydrogenase